MQEQKAVALVSPGVVVAEDLKKKVQEIHRNHQTCC